MSSSRLSPRRILNELKQFGITVGDTFFPFSLWGTNETGEPLLLPDNPLHKRPDRPVTAVTLGAGARGNVYGDYAIEYPEQLTIVGVADPNPLRLERYARKHKVAQENCFANWEDIFKRPKFADAVIISTPDQLHYAPCMQALNMGYDILLEKPISPSEKECRDILALTRKTGRIVAVCHVLRYAPYFVKLRELIHSGVIGDVVSVQHMEPIEHTHMAHSYVRGNWRSSKLTTPILLAKSCHDLDIIKWMLGKESHHIQAFGNLKWFKKENAPKGSKPRCTDGCAVEATCPYSALKIYHRKRDRTYVFDLPEQKRKQGEAILEYLKTSDYGRCVYRMDNDQCDHYTANILFAGDITASFNMEAFTPWGGRRTRIMGSMGFIEGDMDQFSIHDFRTNKLKKYESKVQDVENYTNEGHGGGDWRLVADWIQAVSQHNPDLLSSTIEASIESHIMCFMAEESRVRRVVMDIRM
jgi:Oxidoreductase family, NAD-binding Rossmann fold/Oxidoreductase family, C-terminal alpha/beta domain